MNSKESLDKPHDEVKKNFYPSAPYIAGLLSSLILMVSSYAVIYIDDGAGSSLFISFNLGLALAVFGIVYSKKLSNKPLVTCNILLASSYGLFLVGAAAVGKMWIFLISLPIMPIAFSFVIIFIIFLFNDFRRKTL